MSQNPGGNATLPGTSDPPPSTPAVMLAARFGLELFGLYGLAYWGWAIGNGGLWGTILAMAFALAGAAVWGIFRVHDDPPGKTDHPVIVPGWVRFVIEIGFFGVAAAGFWLGGSRVLSETLMTAVVILYAITWDRQRWLLRQ